MNDERNRDFKFMLQHQSLLYQTAIKMCRRPGATVAASLVVTQICVCCGFLKGMSGGCSTMPKSGCVRTWCGCMATAEASYPKTWLPAELILPSGSSFGFRFSRPHAVALALLFSAWDVYILQASSTQHHLAAHLALSHLTLGRPT